MVGVRGWAGRWGVGVGVGSGTGDICSQDALYEGSMTLSFFHFLNYIFKNNFSYIEM